MKPPPTTSIAPDEVARFSRQAAEWWAPEGPFKALHDLAPLRLHYIKEQVASQGLPVKKGEKPFEGLRFLDVGCGGGLIAEPIAALGGSVTGIDASQQAVEIARAHAAQGGLSVDYHVATPEEWMARNVRYDVITALEIVEHVADLGFFMRALGALLNPGGIVILATLNRTKRSFLLGIVAAEYLLGWVEPGTHDWDKFVKPAELKGQLEACGLDAVDVTGMVYRPLQRAFVLEKGQTAVNYFMTGKKRGKA